jgi:hypothetical protein
LAISISKKKNEEEKDKTTDNGTNAQYKKMKGTKDDYPRNSILSQIKHGRCVLSKEIENETMPFQIYYFQLLVQLSTFLVDHPIFPSFQ